MNVFWVTVSSDTLSHRCERGMLLLYSSAATAPRLPLSATGDKQQQLNGNHGVYLASSNNLVALRTQVALGICFKGPTESPPEPVSVVEGK